MWLILSLLLSRGERCVLLTAPSDLPASSFSPVSLPAKGKPFAQAAEHHRLQNSKCSAAPNGVTRLARSPINHVASRTPPPIQPLASLFQCVYYTAEHKGDTRLHMH